jgi:hypothetical protein
MAWQGFSVTGDAEARLFSQMGRQMTADFDRSEHDEDPLERTELARRLRRMEWPPAPPEVKKRVLDRIVSQHRDEPADGNGRTPSEN